MDCQTILTHAALWMQARGWKQKLAKRLGFEQSLFEHSLIELDVLLELLLILAYPRHYGLSDAEDKILAGAVSLERISWRTMPGNLLSVRRGSVAVGPVSASWLYWAGLWLLRGAMSPGH